MVGQAAEPLVQERNELVEGVTITASDPPEEYRDV
jgi:hypothetical protein